MTYNWLILFAGEFMVENFFVMSAILTSYNLLKKEPGSPLNFPRLIFGRYSRLFPAYIMTILFSASVLPILGSGPFWKAYMLPIAKNCEINWWTNLLMVNNYVNIQNLCISVSWYLGCDFQFFLLSLSVLWLLRSWPKAGLLYLGALLLASILVPAVIAYNFVSSGLLKAINIDILDPTTVTENKYFEYIYAPGHTRAGPYLVGLLAGYLLVKREKSTSKSLSMKISISATVAAAAVLLGIIYVRYLGTFTNLEDMSALRAGLVTGLQKHVWALATTVIILCCTLGQVPVVTSFLSWSAWVPLGNLTYGVVLIHVTGEYLYFGNQRTSYYFNIVQMIGEVAIITIYSYLASLLLHLFIEAPFWRIIDILFPGSKPKRS